ncbi:hypothetical protein A0J61_05504 [Choanephora cucurbitarum]|uniref:Serine palmitoyltransferase small subunit B n=1 Tax=Choanephora cucurbitarum TaxID=101091 RepID=A0A1C7NBL8_9FUNG|nr:hypothetical protein A0J61_05504 [Choanephora cucurbitarum]
MSVFNAFSEYLSKKKYQYELQTALYMLEPWEKALFNSLALCLFVVSAITVYHFITPLYTATAVDMLSQH